MQNGHVDVAELLLNSFEDDIDIYHYNDKNASAFLYACLDGHTSIVSKLISFKSKLTITRDIFYDMINQEAKSIHNKSIDKNIFCNPISACCMNNHFAIMSMLLNENIDKNMKLNFPVVYKSKAAAANNIRSMSSKGLNVNTHVHTSTNTGNNVGMTLIMVACAYGCVESVKELLARDVDVFAKDSEGSNVIHHLVNCIHAKKVYEILLLFKMRNKLRADVLRSFDANGNTPLHVACDLKLVDTVRVLLEEGGSASIKANSIEGYTPLHLAIKKRNEDLVNLLLDFRADPSIEDNRGQSAVKMAEKLDPSSGIYLRVKKASTSWKAVHDVVRQSMRRATLSIVSDAAGPLGNLSSQSMLVLSNGVSVGRVVGAGWGGGGVGKYAMAKAQSMMGKIASVGEEDGDDLELEGSDGDGKWGKTRGKMNVRQAQAKAMDTMEA